MDTPGNILRSERKKQNKSLSGIAKSLKINVEYLEAIEEDKYSLLPAEVYTKAYLRLYAESLGLESDYILSLYKIEPETVPVQETEPPPEKEPFNYKPLFITAAVLIGIILTVMLSTDREQKPVMDVVRETAEPGTVSGKKSDKLSLKITAVELTWISVSIDGSGRQEWLMRPGESTTLAASEKFAVKIGNAGGTRLIFNDEDLGKLGPRGKVVDIVLP
jgi:cytoskeletal protein RodZ